MGHLNVKQGEVMAERKQGVHKTLAEKAKEQYEAQQVTVDKLVEKYTAAQEEVIKLQAELSDANALLDYYEKHPLLQSDYQKIQGIRGMHAERVEEPELPLEYTKEDQFPDVHPEPDEKRAVKVGGKMAWKGFEGKHASE